MWVKDAQARGRTARSPALRESAWSLLPLSNCTTLFKAPASRSSFPGKAIAGHPQERKAAECAALQTLRASGRTLGRGEAYRVRRIPALSTNGQSGGCLIGWRTGPATPSGARPGAQPLVFRVRMRASSTHSRRFARFGCGPGALGNIKVEMRSASS